jgi:hypothetical protein
MILGLPSHQLAQAKCDELIRLWKQKDSEGACMADLYPGFITRMKTLARDFPFLAKG